VPFDAADRAYMAEALRLAEQGLFTTSPNPRVGCVLVKDARIVGQGWHRRAGEAHAEIHALAEAGQAARGATAYVSLEPCAHQGRTPPCAEALIAAGVARVVAAMIDPNPQVAGKGLALLRAAGIATASGLMETEARELNIGFVSRMTRKRPWLRLKAAASLDGKTALNNGESQWITGLEARQDGYRWRARACAILTGIGTAQGDDPQLNTHGLETGRRLLKVVVDSRLALSPSARLFADGGPVLVASAIDDRDKAQALLDKGATWICLPNGQGKVDLAALLQELGRRGVNEVHGEAGFRLNGAFLETGLADELLLYLAPCLLGDKAQGIFRLPELARLENRYPLEIRDVARVGEDLRILARIKGKDQE
jgi:diaminohydroxyphosphoribosylaminopyrimidine deaminase/5-amino-6-(5-phosphoribosylamino)uracil reductase